MIFKMTLSIFLALSALVNVGLIGREGKPYTPAGAVCSVIVNAIIIYGLWFWL